MSNNSNPAPKLRFPEFRKGPGWQHKELGEIAEIKLGKMLDREKHTTGRLLPYLNNIALRWNEVDTSNLPQMYFEEDELDRFGLKAGDVVVCEGGEPGRSAVWDGRLPDLKFQKAIHRVRFTVDFNPRLFVLYLEAIAGTTCFEALFTGGGIKHLTRETFAKLEIPVIPLAEQQKIADCLSSLDDLIAAEGRKLESLRAYKKGLMQQLFPRDGETTPRLRFPEFRNAGEWEELTLGEICKFVRGPFGGALKKDIFVREGYAVYEQSHAIDNQMKRFRYFITVEKYNEMRRFAVNPGDIIMSCSGTMGKFAQLPSKPVAGVINQALLKLSVSGQCNADFILRMLELPSTQTRLLSQSAGGAIKNVVGVPELKVIEIAMPPLAEQQRIAAYLSSLDGLLSAASRKVEALKQHKKGLMQQLFPSAGEGKA